MAQDTVDPKAAKEAMDAQTALIRAQIDLIKAQSDLKAASTPPNEAITEAQAQQARIDAAKALVDARAGLSTSTAAADLAAIQERFGTVAAPANAATGTVTVGTNGGKGEATLLAARAVRLAAAKVKSEIGTLVAGKPLVIVPGIEAPQFGNYLQFEARSKLVKDLLTDATTAASGALQEGRSQLPDAAASGGPATESAFAVAGVALETLNRLGAYFRSDYSVYSLDVAGDTPQLMSAVAGALNTGDHRPGKLTVTNMTLPKVLDATNLLADLIATAKPLRDGAAALRAEAAAARQAASAERDAARKGRFEKAAGTFESGSTAANLALAKVDELLIGLTVADSAGVLPLNRILREKLAYDAVNADRARVLFVDVRSTSAGAYSKKNLMTFFGGMPFYVMGGVTVAYTLVGPDSGVLASGVVPVHGGYRKVNRVQGLIDGLRP